MEHIRRIKNIIVSSSTHNKEISADITYYKNGIPKPVVIFIHGFKGFKDWGPFLLMADFFAKNNFAFLKFNFSHNGTTPEQLLDFADLEAFGRNNFSLEMDDAGEIIDYLYDEDFPVPSSELNNNHVFLVGHSRGGGIAILKAFEEERIQGLATLAATNNLGVWDSTTLDKWKKEGVYYIYNTRTRQEMPLYYQLVENYQEHQSRLDIQKTAAKLQKPWLIIHGSMDETLPVIMARDLHLKNPKSKLKVIEGANHTFGGKHPFDSESLPVDLEKALVSILEFFTKYL